jgi:CheY-like chemotaxis protein
MAGETILVVEDNPMNMKLARATLERAGFVVHGAIDAQAALTALETLRPQLILMDVQLPGMDGLQLTRLIKATPGTAGIVIVAVTAAAMKGDERRAREAGCDGYLTKPIDVRNFARQVAAFLAPAP